MADTDRIVYPDEVDDLKAVAAEAQETPATTTNSVEETPPEAESLQMRNMITVPSNCPAGQTMGADGVCRDVF